jgi:hypothetical protein
MHEVVTIFLSINLIGLEGAQSPERFFMQALAFPLQAVKFLLSYPE